MLRSVSDDFPDKVASVICKTYDKPIVISLVSSQMDADRMDYLLRDAYYTGVNYGTFDLDRILRVLRPYKGKIVVKESGMHAVEDYLMSRYQMYWQVYFHPVTRSSEIILRQIFRRAKELYGDGYPFSSMPEPLRRLFEGKLDVSDYYQLDEALVQTQFMQWTSERDELLADLCRRFLHRKLYKYTTMDERDEPLWARVRGELAEAGLHPDYHLEIDYPFDLPYHVYRPGDSGPGKQPILLLGDGDALSDISERSDIVRSIAGLHRGKFHLYYPEELLFKHRERLSRDVRRLFGLG